MCLLHAQPSLHTIERINIEHGLRDNSVTDFLQDRKGFLWISTARGLHRYDGTTVTWIPFSDSLSFSSANNVYEMIELDSDHLLLTSTCWLRTINTTTLEIKQINFPQKELVAKENSCDYPVIFIKRDYAGNIWVGNKKDLFRLDKNLQIRKRFHFSGALIAEGSRDRFVHHILPLPTNEVLIWLHTGLHIWTPEKDALESIEDHKKYNLQSTTNYNQTSLLYNKYLGLIDYDKNTLSITNLFTGERASCLLPQKTKNKSSSIHYLYGIKDGWVLATYGTNGLTWFHLDDANSNLSIKSYDTHILPDISFGIWFQDKEGNLWSNSWAGGLLKVSQEKQFFQIKKLVEKENKKTPSYEITSFYQDENSLFVASYGNGFYEWNFKTDSLWLRDVRYDNFSENMVWNFHRHTADTFWIGTQQGLLWYNTKNKKIGRLTQSHPKILDTNPITTLFRDSNGLLWIGVGKRGGVCRYNFNDGSFEMYEPSGKYPYNYPLSIAEDKNRDLWFVSDVTAQLVKWIRKENRFEKVELPEFSGSSFSQTGGLYIDREADILWYGVLTAGLIRYDLKSGKTKTYALKDGLNTDQIYSITADKQNVLWLSTSNGISSFNPQTQKFVNYQSQDGLQTSYFSATMHYDREEDIIYAGAPGKIAYFSPSFISEKNKPLKVLLTGLVINNKEVAIPPHRKITLSSNDKNLTLSFTGINLKNGKDNIYAYKLQKGDQDWIEIGKQQQVQLAALKPGNYSLLFTAARMGEDWSTDTDILYLTIPKPFVTTFWFYLLCFILSTLVIYGWYKYRLHQVKKVENIRDKISKDLHDEIGSKLTNIGLLSEIAMQKEGTTESNSWLKKIQKESESISQNMRQIVWSIDPNNDSLEEAMPRMLHFAGALLEAKNITVHADIPDLKGLKIPMEKRSDLFSIFKEAIHNIAKHSGAHNVYIDLDVTKKVLLLTITDDGKGFNEGELAFTNGIKNMRGRAKANHWDLQIESQPGAGCHLNLKLKIT